MAARDNFSDKTRTQISRLAGGLCSYPACRAATFGATSDGSAVLDIGIAAHICAAAAGGPRYDADMTSTDRGSASNGIWMCADHGRAIDADVKFYTVEKLRAWKRDAEREAFLRVTRHPEPAVASIEAADVYRAARADLDVLRQMSKWPASSIALTLKVDGFDEPVTTSGLAAVAQQIEDLVLTAPPGMGKSTTLLQIAASVLDEGNGVPIFLSLGDWASEGRTIMASIFARAAFAHVPEAKFRAAAEGANMVLLLDGWNELDADARNRARVELERLKAEIPRLAFVISTRRQALDVPMTGRRVDLLALSENQQLEIARAIGGDTGEALLDRAWRTSGVRDLVEIPLYLTALLSLGDKAFPETKEELLRNFVAAHEREPRRAEVLLREVKGFQANLLGGLAVFATNSANTAIQTSDARRTLTSSVNALVEDGQLTLRIDTGTALTTLAENTVLMLSAERTSVVFQHQQFQEWFASHDVEARMLESVSSAEARQDLRRQIFDMPAWEEPILFAIERMSRGGEAERRACPPAILAAFDVDPMLAAEMIFRSTDAIWASLEATIVPRVDKWHVAGQADRALRFMMRTGRPEFLDRVWPLIANADTQTSLRALRLSQGLRPGILGANAEARLRALPAEARAVLLGELAIDGGPEALDLVTDVAVGDPDPGVQNRVIDSLSFRYADRHLTKILRAAPDSVLEHSLRYGSPLHFGGDADLVARLDAVQQRVTDQEGPLDELRQIAFGRRPDPGSDALRALVRGVEIVDRQDAATSMIYQAHLLYPQAIAQGLLDRVLEGQPIMFRAGDLISRSGLVLEDTKLLEIAIEGDRHKSGAEAAAAALGPVSAGTLLDKVMELQAEVSDRALPFDKARSERLHTLQDRLGQVPGRSLVTAIQGRTGNADNPMLAQYARLLCRHPQDEDQRGRGYDAATKDNIRALATDWGERLLAAGDTSRSDIAKIATLIEHVPDVRFLDLLRRMLDDNLDRLAKFRVEAAEANWQNSDAVNEVRSPMTHHYLGAFQAIDDPATRSLMLDYLDRPAFAEEAARVLCEQWLANHRPPPERRFGNGVDYSDVAERRAEQLADPAAITDEAQAILAAVERIADIATDEGALQRALTLATIAARMPHGGHDALYRRLVALAAPSVRARLLLIMALSGDPIDIGVIKEGLAATFEAGKTEPWILIDSDAWRLRDWIQLLPLASDLSDLVEIVTDIPVQHRRTNRLEVVIAGLGAVPSHGAEQALFGLAALDPDLLQNHAWSSAALTLETASGLESLVALIAEGSGVGTSGARDWGWPKQLGDRLVDYPEVRQNLIARLEGSAPSEGHQQLALALASQPDHDALEMLIDLERHWKIRLIDYRTLQAMVTEQVPSLEWSNSYSIVPKPAPALRRRLLHLTTDGGGEDRAALLLTQIDTMRDEYGLAFEEPRHPDLGSGRPWPVMISNREAAQY